MITVSFYHKDTGVICDYHLHTSDETTIALNTPTDHRAIDGHYDHLSQRIDVSVAPATVPVLNQHGIAQGTRLVYKILDYQPPQPSPDHEWDGTTKRWRLSAAAVERNQQRAAAAARIVQLEASQHAVVRELLLGNKDARAQLQEIHDNIKALSQG